ncbi:cyclase family protein [Scytonema hofmannii FACHB-248]|uniref:Cyclase family protein n=1 Tax=Scytonema hofmannii FACHB-248 TaxID=1842502 RepID=A0ABR8GTP7_9CYAN|nr:MULTISPECIES: cyclase family protein [Nostocales]MBD2606088.1 cyclase family protein [Scytonema hofmannii FACHB-248]
MDCDRSILDITNSFLLQQVAPKANEIDSNPQALYQALQGLGNLGLLALRTDKHESEATFGDFQELIARYSGTLAFVQTQHQSAAAMLMTSDNSALKQVYLKRMGNGEVLMGVGFSQLRRQGEPLTLAVPVAGGYQLDGVVPWVTGWNLFQHFIIAATLPDGSAVFGIVPFVQTSQITFTTPAQLAAMTSSNTVSATLTRWFLPQERVVFIKPPGWIHENDKNNILRATFLATGCAFAGLDIIDAAKENKSLPFIHDAFESLLQELTKCRTLIREAQLKSIETAKLLQMRAWAIDLATRIAHAAVTVSSGAANYMHHPAQRVYREALVFTVTGQTTAVMEATLQQLTRSSIQDKEFQPQINADKRGYSLLYQRPSAFISGSKLEQLKRSPIQDKEFQPQINADKRGYSLLYQRSSAFISGSKSSVIHLSHIIDPDVPQWEGDPPVEFETVAELEKDGYYLRRFSLGEHSATHINAPKSFHNFGVGIDKYPAESLVVSAVVIDIRVKTTVNFDYILTVADVLAWEEEYGEIPANSVVLLYTGWQDKWCDKDAFFNQDAEGSVHFPGFGSDAVQFLLDEREIAGVGIDTHGVDSGQDTSFTINRLVLEKPRIVLENLTNLDRLPPRGVMLAIAPLLLQHGSGSPVGVLALVPGI